MNPFMIAAFYERLDEEFKAMKESGNYEKLSAGFVFDILNDVSSNGNYPDDYEIIIRH